MTGCHVGCLLLQQIKHWEDAWLLSQQNLRVNIIVMYIVDLLYNKHFTILGNNFIKEH